MTIVPVLEFFLRPIRSKLHLISLVVLWASALICGCPRNVAPDQDVGADNGTDITLTDPDGAVYIRFTNEGVTLDATTESDGEAQTTVIKSGDETILRIRTTLTSMQILFPTESDEPAEISFDPPLETTPSEYALNRLATMIAGDVFVEPSTSSRLQVIPDCVGRNRPGCDFWPDIGCTLRCCAEHDRCYFENGCCATSWLFPWFPLLSSPECWNCNAVVAGCMIVNCRTGSEGDPNSAVCYDSACGMEFSCPEFNCNCARPCPVVQEPDPLAGVWEFFIQDPITCGGTCPVECKTEYEDGTGLGFLFVCREAGDYTSNSGISIYLEPLVVVDFSLTTISRGRAGPLDDPVSLVVDTVQVPFGSGTEVDLILDGIIVDSSDPAVQDGGLSGGKAYIVGEVQATVREILYCEDTINAQVVVTIIDDIFGFCGGGSLVIPGQVP